MRPTPFNVIFIAGCHEAFVYRFRLSDHHRLYEDRLWIRAHRKRAIGLATAEVRFVVWVRDGESVKAEARVADGHDFVQVNIALNLGPPIQSTSGTYQATVGGHTAEGTVACQSLTFLGG